jgi:putative tricarboxylic transport membrane protein
VSTTEQQPEESSGRSPDERLREEHKPDYAQYIVVAVLAIFGGFLVYSAMSLPEGFAKVDPVGPKLFPMVVGVAALVLAVILAIAIPRGSKGEADAGEDIDPDAPGDWRTVGLLIALFVAMILLVNPLGWVITSTLFFAGAATVLGSNHYVRNFVIGLVLALASFYAFYSGLGIPLPAGILDGIL